jgi:predicted aspartyl protease
MTKKNLFKTLMITSIAIFLYSCTGSVKNDATVDGRMAELLENKDFFKLRAELETDGVKLSEERLLYYKTFCEMAFGNEQQSNKYATDFLEKYGKQNDDSLNMAILEVKAHNYIMNHLYKDAVDVYEVLLSEYQNLMDSSEISEYQNIKNLFGALVHVKPQQIHKTKNSEFASRRNQFNHLMIPVKYGGISDEFIFDTGANLSTITDSCAHKMGLTIYESDIKVGAAQGKNIQTKLAVADSFYVDDILFENVVFLVAPAETMSVPELNLEIHGVIGFPVLRQMGEIHLQKEGKIFIPANPQDRKLSNMFFDGLVPVVQAFSGQDTLLFIFDTGGAKSELSQKYYESHKSEIEQNGTLKKAKRGSAGGVIEVEEYILPDFSYTIGTKSAVLPSMSVSLDKYDYHKSYDGSIGQDINTRFNILIINFKYMFIDYE